MRKIKPRRSSRSWAMIDFLEGKVKYQEIDKRAIEYEKSLRELEKQFNVKFK